MTNEEQNIAIAKWLGWTSITKTHHLLGIVPDAEMMDSQDADITLVPIPDYGSDLNAMHEAELKLDYETWCLFRMNLGDVVKNKQHLNWITPYNYVSATSSQRLEALLRTIGKWKD